jgi:hemoglobin
LEFRGRVGYRPGVVTEAMDQWSPEEAEQGIRRLVAVFYARVRRDAVLGPVFARALGEDEEAWSAHLARVSDFWSSVMLRSGRYHGDPFSVHLRLPRAERIARSLRMGLFERLPGPGRRLA